MGLALKAALQSYLSYASLWKTIILSLAAIEAEAMFISSQKYVIDKRRSYEEVFLSNWCVYAYGFWHF